MENLLLVVGYLMMVTVVLTIVEIVSKLIAYWKYLCDTDDGLSYEETWK